MNNQEQDQAREAICWLIILLVLGYVFFQGCAALLDPDHSARERSRSGNYTQPAEGP